MLIIIMCVVLGLALAGLVFALDKANRAETVLKDFIKKFGEDSEDNQGE